MNRWLRFLALFIVAGVSIALGAAPEAGFDHVWLSVALIAIFWASEARFWDPSRRQR